MDEELSLVQWSRVSQTLDYIFAQQPTKVIRESPGVTAIRGEAPKPQAKKLVEYGSRNTRFLLLFGTGIGHDYGQKRGMW